MKGMLKVKKRYITLIEIMIVMFLIALITGVLAYNYRGSLEEGKVFKTKAAMEKLDTILNLAVARGEIKLDDIRDNWRTIVENSSLVQNPKDLEFDGWGYPFEVDKDDSGKISVKSQGYDEYLRRKEGK